MRLLMILVFVFMGVHGAFAADAEGLTVEPYPWYNALSVGATRSNGVTQQWNRMFLGGGLRFAKTARVWCDTMSEYASDVSEHGEFRQFADVVCGMGLESIPHLDVTMRLYTNENGLLDGPFAGIRFSGAWTLLPEAFTYLEVDPGTDGRRFNFSVFVSQEFPFRKWLDVDPASLVPNLRLESIQVLNSDGGRFGDVFAFVDDIYRSPVVRVAPFAAWQFPGWARDGERIIFGLEFRPGG